MSDEAIRGAGPFRASFKRFFIRGLATLLPTLLTIAILVWAYRFVDRNIGRHITHGLVLLLASRGADAPVDLRRFESDLLRYGTPTDQFDQQRRRLTREYKIVADPNVPTNLKRQVVWQVIFRKYHLGLLGFVIAIIAVYFVGFFLASFLGRTTWRIVESALVRIPLIKTIYPYIKQVTDFLLSERGLSFSGVVAVQYPRKGIWSVGLLTGPGLRAIRDRAGSDVVSVFIPSSPSPVTGYVITVSIDEVVELPISIDEALRFVVTGGVVKPGRQQTVLEGSQVAALVSQAGSDHAELAPSSSPDQLRRNRP